MKFIKRMLSKRIFALLSMIIADIIAVFIAYILALFFRFSPAGWPVNAGRFIAIVPVFVAVNIISFFAFKTYRRVWKYTDASDIVIVWFANAVAYSLSYYSFVLFLADASGVDKGAYQVPVFASAWLFACILSTLTRVAYRMSHSLAITFKFVKVKAEDDKRIRVMIVGAGEAGSIIINEINKWAVDKYRIVGVVDDKKAIKGMSLHGYQIQGSTDEIENLARKLNVQDIIVAIPSATSDQMSRILNECTKTGCHIRVMPRVSEMPEEYSLKSVRNIKIEDLLGRDAVNLNIEGIAAYLSDVTVMVTGGGGSIGSELCRQIMNFSPKRLVIFDIYENNAYELLNEIRINKKYDNIPIDICIGSVRDVSRLEEVFEEYKPGVVFHAAAYKHVPLMEDAPHEAVRNNILGSYNVAKCADKYGVRRFVMISTDKAVNPTNIMGATKRVAELIVQSLNKKSKTEFVAVRFGNVLGSNGSVIPLFTKQIEKGGPVTVTHPEITRFFMTIPEAAQLVIQAGAIASGGEIFILDMGEPVKIVDLAEKFIRLSGYTPGVDMQIKFVGLRPGEKLYEELLLSEEGICKSSNDKIYIAKASDIGPEECERLYNEFADALDNGDVMECIQKNVGNFKHALNRPTEK